MKRFDRRGFLQQGLLTSGALLAGPCLFNSSVFAQSTDIRWTSKLPVLGKSLHEVSVINDPDTRMRIPTGFSVREVARTGKPAFKGSDYAWHGAPDGGAVFATDDGGWIYVSNAELGKGQGGVGAIRFNPGGDIVDSYSILSGSSVNCAGGPTPWGTWLSCEEHDSGLVYECDPYGKEEAVACPMLGAFKHEAAAVDPVHKHIYMTEDEPDGNLYRYTPEHYPDNGRADLSTGKLEVAEVQGNNFDDSRPVKWRHVTNPVPQLSTGSNLPTRNQVAEAEAFNGGEGCWYHDGIVYFSTKGDNRVWALDIQQGKLELLYDKKRDRAFRPAMNDVDNVTVSAAGDVLVAEDGPEMRIVVFSPDSKPYELVNILGHRGSEITGPAFSPDGSRLYFSSQNGPAGTLKDGRTYELTGPFFG